MKPAVAALVTVLSWHHAAASAGPVVFADGILRVLNPNTAAFVGGSVGVVGTLVAISARRRAVRDRLACVICKGEGSIECGRCFGTGRGADGGRCAHCLPSPGRVPCVSCQGSGNSVLSAEARNAVRLIAGLGMNEGLERGVDE